MDNNSFNFERLIEFDNHRQIIYLHDEKVRLRGFIAIHRGGVKSPAFGATRLWKYPTQTEALKDALKLSRIMTYKSAMAGLKYGGAKAVLIDPQDPQKRFVLLRTYTNYVNCFAGSFITGADVGISRKDLKVMNLNCKYIVGYRSDPVKFTALGLFYGIQVCLQEVFGTEELNNRTFAIQGLGKTGLGLLKLIYKQAKKICVSDIDPITIKMAKAAYPKIEAVSISEIFNQAVDVFSPCALSNAINLNNVSQLRCKIIAGSANSQLENDSIGEVLYKLGILYAPDYVINAGGLITVVDEYEHKNSKTSRVKERIVKLKENLKIIFKKSQQLKQPTNVIADKMAKKLFRHLI